MTDFTTFTCTYCGGSEWIVGPSGGMAQNMLCANKECRHWFNNMGPFGWDDLKRVEPSPEEAAAAQLAEQDRRIDDTLARARARAREGREAFAAGRSIFSLRTDPNYGPVAENSKNVDRFLGYIEAFMEAVKK